MKKKSICDEIASNSIIFLFEEKKWNESFTMKNAYEFLFQKKNLTGDFAIKFSICSYDSSIDKAHPEQ